MSTQVESDLTGTPTTKDLRQQAKVVKEDLRGLTRTAKEVAQDKLGDVRDRASSYVDDGKKKSAELYEQGKEKALKVEDHVEGYIRKKPLQSVMIAAGAGVVLGFLLSRR